MTEIAGRGALVTGGASGIGRLVARKLARRGARVAIWDVDGPGTAAAIAEIERFGGQAWGFGCDVGDRVAVADVAAQTTETVGPIDILVNNAGVVSGQLLLDLPPERIETTFKVNVLALYWVTRAFLPHMIERNAGHVVTIASAAGLVGVPRQTDYSASKHAAVGFDESLRGELRRLAPGVMTTVVCPFYIDTGMFAGVRTRFPLLLPILKEDAVAERVVAAIRHDRRQVIMPPMVRTLPLMRILPVDLFDAVNEFFGVYVSMDGFVGRQGQADREAAD